MITMHHQLLRMGHAVDVFVYPSEVNNLISAQCDKNTFYDLAIINHNKCLDELSGWNIKRRIFTAHGIAPQLEQPVPGADVYVSVSEEVQSNLKQKGFESVIIRNPINTEYFSPVKPHKELKRLLWMNNRAATVDLVDQASMGFDFRIQTGWKPDVKENIQWADLVMTSGRGIYEALSCGKNAMVVNWCGCDGMVTQDTIFEFRKKNCSGRTKKEFWAPERIRSEFKKYDCNRNMRPYVLENNNVKTIAERYLSL